MPAVTTLTQPGAQGFLHKVGSEPSAWRPFNRQGQGRGLLPTPHLTELCGQSTSGGGGAATAWDNMAQRGEAAGKTRGHGLRMWLQMPGRAPQ